MKRSTSTLVWEGPGTLVACIVRGPAIGRPIGPDVKWLKVTSLPERTRSPEDSSARCKFTPVGRHPRSLYTGVRRGLLGTEVSWLRTYARDLLTATLGLGSSGNRDRCERKESRCVGCQAREG